MILYKIKFTKDYHEMKVSVKESQMQIFEGQPVTNGMYAAFDPSKIVCFLPLRR